MGPEACTWPGLSVCGFGPGLDWTRGRAREKNAEKPQALASEWLGETGGERNGHSSAVLGYAMLQIPAANKFDEIKTRATIMTGWSGAADALSGPWSLLPDRYYYTWPRVI